MYTIPNILWLNTNPYLRRFNLPAVQKLSKYHEVGHWEYQQTEDEGTSFEQGVKLLDEYIAMLNKPVHLVGHGTCGLLGWYYAHHYPDKVKTLNLLAVGVNPALDWVSYYYLWRNSWHCSQEIVLSHLAKYLFGSHSHYYRKALVKILTQAVSFSLSRHSLYKKYSYHQLPQIDCPVNIIGSREDQIVPWNEITKWQNHSDSVNYLWQCPQGDHFFHYFQPQLVAEKLSEFITDQYQSPTQIIIDRAEKLV